MRITGLALTRVRVNQRGDWLFVRLTTDEGLTGLGEASHGGAGPNRDALVAAILTQQCLPALVGHDPRAVLVALTALTPIADGFAGRTAVSACEQALWDLAGQAAGLPIHRLFGGPTRERIPLYANINRATVERTPASFARNAAAAVAEGFGAIKLAPFDGLARQELRERAGRERIVHGLACVAAVRDAVGPAVAVYVDCHGRFDVPTAREAARELRALGVTWCEEPVPTADLPALGQLRPILAGQGMEALGGEHLGGIAAFWPYLAAGVWDTIMPDVKHCGGIAEAVALGRLAAARGVGIAPHNPSGPVAMAASAQVVAALPEVRALEYAWGEVPWRARLVVPPERITDGALLIPSGPGLGLALDEETAAPHRIDVGA
jgi:galactonate dehydratase